MNAHWPSRCASASSILRLGLLALLIGLVPGCKKGEGRTCYMAAECGEGLACVGDALKRCETCAGSASCQSDGSCSARDGRCIAASSEDCKQGYLCTGKGACTAKGDTSGSSTSTSSR